MLVRITLKRDAFMCDSTKRSSPCTAKPVICDSRPNSLRHFSFASVALAVGAA